MKSTLTSLVNLNLGAVVVVVAVAVLTVTAPVVAGVALVYGGGKNHPITQWWSEGFRRLCSGKVF